MARLFFRSPVGRARTCGLVLVAAALGLWGGTVATQAPRFYPDDPIAREPESRDAGRAAKYEIESLSEMTHNLFVTAGHTPSGTRARTPQHDRRGARLELVREPHRQQTDHH